MARKYTEEFLLNEIRRFYNTYNKIPTVKDFKEYPGYPSVSPYKRKFGSWNDALKETGLGVNLIIDKFTKEEIQKIINDYIGGLTTKQISRKYKRSESIIYEKLKDNNIFEYKYNIWTDRELDTLNKIYPNNDWENILSQLPRHNKDIIKSKASELGIQKEDFFWNENDIIILKNGYNDNLPTKEIKLVLNNKFSERAIISKAEKLGIKKVFKWEDWEIEYLKENYDNTKLDDICLVLNRRNRKTITMMAMELGVNHSFSYTEEELQFIRDNYLSLTDKEIAKHINRSLFSVQGKRYNLGLKRQRKDSYEYLDNYLRGKIFKWKKDSMKFSKYKCILSGQRFDDIHHLFGIGLIIDEIFDNTNIDYKSNFNDYTEEELDIIKDKFVEIHDKYPLGVCLTGEIHDLFHINYGYGDNTPEQFHEFKRRYDNGEFNEILNNSKTV